MTTDQRRLAGAGPNEYSGLARVIYDPRRDMLVATLPYGAQVVAHDPRNMAQLLFAAGVRHGKVSMPLWVRDDNIAPAAGEKIALNWCLNRLGGQERGE
ncbi:hypothetical protein [Paraburkholderia hospita]|uniref:hypothetical protein n=1 Tax=Paraburkholderia hospita TaxID=169430 RepID=UPI003ECC8761